MKLSRTEVAGLVFASCSIALAFPIAWESHLMNRCISSTQGELRKRAAKKESKQMSYFISAVSKCNGSELN